MVTSSFLSPLVTAWRQPTAVRRTRSRRSTRSRREPAWRHSRPRSGPDPAEVPAHRRCRAVRPARRRRVGGREERLRLAFADGFLAAGDRPRALMIIDGMGAGEFAARQRIMAGKIAARRSTAYPRRSRGADGFRRGSCADAAFGAAARTGSGRTLYRSQDSSTTVLLALLLAHRKRQPRRLRCSRPFPRTIPDPRRPRRSGRVLRTASAMTKPISWPPPGRFAAVPTPPISRGLATCCRR